MRRPSPRHPWRGVLALVAGLLAAATVHAGVAAQALRQTFTDYCSRSPTLDLRQQDQLLRLADAARRELERSGAAAAIVSRAGLDLQRFGQRYSHAGIGLRDGATLPWAVRQLYYACDERRPRLFDQGLAGFVMGSDDAHGGFVRLLLLPDAPQSEALRQAALDTPRAAGLVAPRYSANAYVYGLRYQNCNQWLAELIGEAWQPMPVASEPEARRAAAQAALRQLGYRPQPFVAGRFTQWAARWVPLLHLDDHPDEDLQAERVLVSMPTSVEDLVLAHVPGVRRVELCRADDRIVVRRDGPPMGERCEAAEGDEVQQLD